MECIITKELERFELLESNPRQGDQGAAWEQFSYRRFSYKTDTEVKIDKGEVYESSGDKTESLWIAHTANNAKDNSAVDYKRKNSTLYDQLTDSDYSTTPASARTPLSDDNNSRSANNARAAVIDVLTGGADPTGGAVQWDGDDFLEDGESHRKFKDQTNVKISSDHLQTYSMGPSRPGKSIDGIFWVPIIFKTDFNRAGNPNKYHAIESTGAKGRSIFWKLAD